MSAGPAPPGTSGGSGTGGTGPGTVGGSGSNGGTGAGSGWTSSGTSAGTGSTGSTSASSGGASSGATGGSGGIGGSSSGGLGSGSGGGIPSADASVPDSASDGAFAGEPFTFTLIDSSIIATNGSPVPGFDPIPNGATIDLAAVGYALSVRANVTDPNVADVEFDLDESFSHTEYSVPYMLCSNNGPKIFDCNLTTGAHVLRATVFFPSRQGTTTGPTSVIAFVIVDSSADAAAD